MKSSLMITIGCLMAVTYLNAQNSAENRYPDNSWSLPDSVAQEWVSNYTVGTVTIDYARAIAVDAAGNVYVTGSSEVASSFLDYATVKYNADGVEQWVARYNGPGNERDDGTDIAVDASGNVYVTGSSRGDTTNLDFATIKYNSDGVEQWVSRYNGPQGSFDSGRALLLDGAGNIYVTGESLGIGSDFDYATVKYNANGVEQWVRRYNGPGNSDDYARYLILDGAGNIYVSGQSMGATSDFDYATLKYNANGVEQWVARYTGPGNGVDQTAGLGVDNAGNVYVTGKSWNNSTFFTDYATVKYNAVGAEQWVTRYAGLGAGDEQATDMILDQNGDVYVTGLSRNPVANFDYTTLKYNPDGVEQWVRRYNGPGGFDDTPSAITLDGAGNIYLTGSISGAGNSRDIGTIKYRPDGTEQWVAIYDGPTSAADDGFAIAVDDANNVYVTGSSSKNNGAMDYTTIKYSQQIVSALEPLAAPQRFSLGQNYPNPFNPATTIEFSLERSSLVSLKVYNMLGQKVATLVSEQLGAGTYKYSWSGNDLPGGVYFYKMTTGEMSLVKKALLLK